MKSILIADDHFDTVELMQSFLMTLGYDAPAAAYDGHEAIEIARRVRPASIVLDIGLPIINGFEVARTLRQSEDFAETSIIGCSGYVGAEYFERAREAGMDFYLPKPVDPQVLAACLEPEKHLDILAQNISILASNVAEVSRELLERSFQLQKQAQALSNRSASALRRAQELTRIIANRSR